MKKWVFLTVLFWPTFLFAVTDTLKIPKFHMLGFDFIYRAQYPLGKLSEYYGMSSGIGFGVHFQHEKGWFAGANISYTFGNGVKNKNTLDAVTTSDGDLLAYNGGNGYLTQPKLGQRGIITMAHGGYFIPKSKSRLYSGVFFKVGVGYVDHRIFFNTPGNQVLHLNKTYKKGYDRLFSGMITSAEIGWQYHDHRKNYINFQISAEVMPCFVKYRRGYDYAAHVSLPNSMQTFAWWGLKFNWFIPRFIQSGGNKKSKEFQFN